MKSNTLSSPNPSLRGRASLVAGLGMVAALAACAAQPTPQAAWIPESQGWEVRDAEEADSVTWVAYDRDAPGTDVKEIRVVGLVDSEPEVTMRALRHRLTDDEYAPEGMEIEVLERSDDELVTYGLARMPWPLRDREVTERTRFVHDAASGTFRVEVDNIDTNQAVPRGVVRVELVRNVFEVRASEHGGSVLSVSSVHDMGGAFPNSAIYTPVTDGMVEMLFDVRSLASEFEHTASETR